MSTKKHTEAQVKACLNKVRQALRLLKGTPAAARKCSDGIYFPLVNAQTGLKHVNYWMRRWLSAQPKTRMLAEKRL